jgi:hypothetical protein
MRSYLIELHTVTIELLLVFDERSLTLLNAVGLAVEGLLLLAEALLLRLHLSAPLARLRFKGLANLRCFFFCLTQRVALLLLELHHVNIRSLSLFAALLQMALVRLMPTNVSANKEAGQDTEEQDGDKGSKIHV